MGINPSELCCLVWNRKYHRYKSNLKHIKLNLSCYANKNKSNPNSPLDFIEINYIYN